MRRAALFLSACAAALNGAIGCGMIAGIGDSYDTSALTDGGGGGSHDATVGADGGGGADVTADGSRVEPDVQIPDDVFIPDANAPVPDAADAACKPPAPGQCSDNNPCCAPAVCNADGKCVAQCLTGNGCGSQAACCWGRSCNEYATCETNNCGNDKAICDPILAPCCVGFVCPPAAVAFCQKCADKGGGCPQGNWQCCSKNCGGDGKCR